MVNSDAVQTLERGLRDIFGGRLQSLVTYGRGPGPVRALAVVDVLTADDLRGCAQRVASWREAGTAAPLLFAAHEFERSLDAFPLEFGAILADHTVIAGADPFASLAVDPADVRRACEVQARSHLLHLREGFLETGGRGDAISVLIVQSAPAFAALVSSIARLEGHAVDDAGAAARQVERILGTGNSAVGEVVKLSSAHDMPSAEGERLFAPYLDVVTRLVKHVDSWTRGR